MIMKKTGRNDPCPCGSGKKYKQCCQRNEEVRVAETHSLDASIRKSIQAALAHHQAGRLPQAEAIYQQILEVAPNHSDALHLLGVIAHQVGKDEVAVELISKALGVNPSSAMYCNLGLALKGQGKHDAAIESYHKALSIKRDYAEAHYNLGIALQEQDNFDEAIASYRKALKFKPDYAEAHYNLGNTLKDQGKLEAALESYRKALSIKPDYAAAHSNYLMIAQCDPNHSPAELLAHHLAFAERFEAPLRVHWPSHDNDRDTRRRLKVGFVSGDLRTHPVGYFLESLLAHLDRKVLDVVLYPTHSQVDALTQRLQAMGFAWESLVGLSDDRAAHRIREDAIDILVDLSGHTDHNRLRVFARKPAPVQVTWLGYLATTGLRSMDYILCDRYMAPANEAGHFVEKPWYLPDTRLCFTPPQHEVAVGALPALANGRVTFGCFNYLTKMNDAVVALWAQVLHSVPGSRLFLKSNRLDDPSVQQATWSRFADRGIAADRLALEGASSRADYLATYNRVDIALDPFPFTGGTTSVEGLWMGVPVITKRGDRFVAHQGESILHNVGLPDWIAADNEGYVAIAVARANDLSGLATLRAGLRSRLLASPLCNALLFARNFEAALRGMWRAYCNQEHTQLAPPMGASDI
jgi:protein O-GlcNAc transferase